MSIESKFERVAKAVERLADIEDAERCEDRPVERDYAAFQDVGWHRQARRSAADEIGRLVAEIRAEVLGD